MAYKTVNKVLIGADIARTANVDNGVLVAAIATLIAEGEVVLLDSDGDILPATPTIADSTSLRIGVGTSTTFTEGLLTYREVLVSDPISSRLGDILLYSATGYEAPVQKMAVIDGGTFAPTADEEYVIRIVYKDMYEHPGMYSQTYRYIAQAGDVLADVIDAFATLITNDAKSRVTASNALGVTVAAIADGGAGYTAGDVLTVSGGAGAAPTILTVATEAVGVITAVTITEPGSYVTAPTNPAAVTGGTGAGATFTLTLADNDDLLIIAKPIPSNAIKYSIDEYRMVEFEVFLFSDNFDNIGDITYVSKVKGIGEAGLVRDAEKKGLSHRGITNRTSFPVPGADSNMVVDMALDYDLIQIHYNRPYQSANNQILEHTQTSIELYLPVTAGQANNVLADLDTWMVSAGMPTQAGAF